MDYDVYKALGLTVFDTIEGHIKTVLVQERIGRFQLTDRFTKVLIALNVDCRGCTGRCWKLTGNGRRRPLD